MLHFDHPCGWTSERHRFGWFHIAPLVLKTRFFSPFRLGARRVNARHTGKRAPRISQTGGATSSPCEGCFIPWAARPKSGTLCAARRSAAFDDIHFANDDEALARRERQCNVIFSSGLIYLTFLNFQLDNECALCYARDHWISTSE